MDICDEADVIHCECCNDKCYDDDKIKTVRWIYIIFIIIWICTIYFFSIYKIKYAIILMLPIILFIIAIINAPYLCEEVESELFKIIYFPMIIIVSINLFSWLSKDNINDGKILIRCIFISIVFLLLSSLDIWMNKKWIFAYRHVQSAFELMSVTLIIFVVIIYGISYTSS